MSNSKPLLKQLGRIDEDEVAEGEDVTGQPGVDPDFHEEKDDSPENAGWWGSSAGAGRGDVIKARDVNRFV